MSSAAGRPGDRRAPGAAPARARSRRGARRRHDHRAATAPARCLDTSSERAARTRNGDRRGETSLIDDGVVDYCRPPRNRELTGEVDEHGGKRRRLRCHRSRSSEHWRADARRRTDCDLTTSALPSARCVPVGNPRGREAPRLRDVTRRAGNAQLGGLELPSPRGRVCGERVDRRAPTRSRHRRPAGCRSCGRHAGVARLPARRNTPCWRHDRVDGRSISWLDMPAMLPSRCDNAADSLGQVSTSYRSPPLTWSTARSKRFSRILTSGFPLVSGYFRP